MPFRRLFYTYNYYEGSCSSNSSSRSSPAGRAAAQGAATAANQACKCYEVAGRAEAESEGGERQVPGQHCEAGSEQAFTRHATDVFCRWKDCAHNASTRLATDDPSAGHATDGGVEASTGHARQAASSKGKAIAAETRGDTAGTIPKSAAWLACKKPARSPQKSKDFCVSCARTR